jgi:LPS-assembly lipoprotein
MRRLLSIASLICLLVMLEACGFRLRGAYVFPPEMQQTFMVAKKTEADVSLEIIDQLQRSGIELTVVRDAATAVLKISQASAERDIVSRNFQGRPLQYSAVVKIRFSVETPDGKILIPRSTVTAETDVTQDITDPLSSRRELDNAFEKLRESAVRKMLRRIEGAASAQE